MASVRTEISINARAEDVWAVIGDFGKGPVLMAPGFVVSSDLVEPDLRVVTFVNGVVLHERLITLDDEDRRLVFAVIAGAMQPTHDNAVMQVFADGPDHSRFVWTHDVLPAELAPKMEAAMQHGSGLLKQAMETRS